MLNPLYTYLLNANVLEIFNKYEGSNILLNCYSFLLLIKD